MTNWGTDCLWFDLEVGPSPGDAPVDVRMIKNNLIYSGTE